MSIRITSKNINRPSMFTTSDYCEHLFAMLPGKDNKIKQLHNTHIYIYGQA